MNIIFFNNEIILESIIELIEKIEENNSKNITIYFSSSGGNISESELLIDYVNNCSKKIKWVIYNELHSAAFTSLLKMKGEKIILDSSLAIIHKIKLTWSKFFILNFIKGYINKLLNNKQITFIEEDNKELLKLYRCSNVDIKYLKEIEKGKDIYLSSKELKKIFIGG